jgi:uncharacterized membrane protein (DUF485 family)
VAVWIWQQKQHFFEWLEQGELVAFLVLFVGNVQCVDFKSTYKKSLLSFFFCLPYRYACHPPTMGKRLLKTATEAIFLGLGTVVVAYLLMIAFNRVSRTDSDHASRDKYLFLLFGSNFILYINFHD